jgi:hypothetical protein
MTLGYMYTAENGEEVEVIRFTQAEWDFRRQAAFAEAGVTYEELEAQAHRGYFDSMDLHYLWIMNKDRSGDS